MIERVKKFLEICEWIKPSGEILVMASRDGLDGYIKLPEPDDSIVFFETIKRLSEAYWATIRISKRMYGFQVQRNTKWNDGLTNNQINDFERKLDMKFPMALRNFYRTMNGLDKRGVNVYGGDGTAYAYSPMYYSFPGELDIMKEKISWIEESNNLTEDKMRTENIPKIFPVAGHRFLILDGNNQILSMYGNDIIFWADNISKLIANDIFDEIYNAYDFESNPANAKPIKFWLEK